MDLSSRRKNASGLSSRVPSNGRGTSSKRSGVHYTSEMQGILTIKENNESKAADLVAEYLTSVAEQTYDEITLTKNLDNMLNGFSIEEKLRIVSKALVRALCNIS